MNNWNEIVELDTDEDEQIMQEAYCVSALIGQYAIHHLCKEPCRDGDKTELVRHGLKPTTRTGVEEMVGIFLSIVGHGVDNRMTQEIFQHSGETVSRHFHNVLTACLKLSMAYIRPQDHMFRDSQSKLQNDQRYWPFFKNAIGAIDGTHIPCVVSPSDHLNIFLFSGKYYLVDAGYPTPKGYLGPYRCERYHLPDFRRQSGFSNHNEVFNYYHSSLRCTIERTFGVWKNRFAILRKMPKYKIETQVQLVCATMAIHNFIRRHADMDIDFNRYEDENIIVGTDDHNQLGDVNSESSSVLSISSSPEMDHVRDIIRDQIVMSNNIN
ncbi:uncharacterized protein LOC130735170 [Lotus japonicus]|uniref:uncharacterized protein LOC130735170 n=1 Tax=Lotus japonicus TaxID=34305 RepID=UPI002586C898|nr:uncharacterized protein LOC130735170 [Lotus japonicus]